MKVTIKQEQSKPQVGALPSVSKLRDTGAKNKKRTIRKWMLLAALPALLLAACSKDDVVTAPDGPTTHGGDIKFEIGFAPRTRVATDTEFRGTWEDGDEIGIFAVKCDRNARGTLTDSQNYIHNVKLTYNSADGGSWSGPLYWNNDDDYLEFYAYYPYDNNGDNPAGVNPLNLAFNVATDQNGTTNGKSNHNLSDLLTAYSQLDLNGQWYTKGSIVTLRFSHAMAMMQVNIPKGGAGWGADGSQRVMLRNVKAKVAVNLSTVSSTPESGVTLAVDDNTPVNITMHCIGENEIGGIAHYSYRALVPAQEIAAGNNLFRFEHEQRQLFDDAALTDVFPLAAGWAETFERTLPQAVHTVAIPKGTFMMGSPATEPNRYSGDETQHQVTLTKDFRMSKYQVTNAQYAAFLNANGIKSDGKWASGQYPTQRLIIASSGSFDWGLHWNSTDNKWEPSGANNTDYSDHPVIYVTWYGAMEYARWVGGALPTEAQWEYACRGDYENKATETDTKPFGIGDGTKLTYDMANFDIDYPYDVEQGGQYKDVSGPGYKGSTTPVGFYSDYVNNYGLYDMHGNVHEWCYDSWSGVGSGSESATDPVSPNPGSYRVSRGGYWNFNAQFCRSAFRSFGYPDNAYSSIGFRMVFVL